MNVTKVKKYLSEIDELIAAIEAEIEAEELVTDLKTRQKKLPKTKGAIPLLTAHQGVLESVTHDIQHIWVAMYRDHDWISREISKCVAWCLSKNIRTKNWGLRIGNWLSNAYESKSKNQDPVRRAQDPFARIVED